jgi:short-subunit dehydrogenase
MTKAVLPAMREQGAGRVVFVSGVVGFLPAPFMGFYAASKHALEGYAESLNHEVRTLGIRAVLVEPGFMRTRIDQNTVYGASKIASYEAARSRVAEQINTNVENGDDPAIVARTILAAIEAPNPWLRYPVGKGASMLRALRRLLPARMFGRSLRKEFRVDA